MTALLKNSFAHLRVLSNLIKHEFCSQVNKDIVRKTKVYYNGLLDPNYLHELRDFPIEQKTQFDNNMLDLIQKQKSNNLQWADMQMTVAQCLKNKNIDNVNYVILSKLVFSGFYEQGELFCKYVLESDSSKVNIATLGQIFELYSNIGKNSKLSEEQKIFFLEQYDKFHKKYSLFDPITNERAIKVFSQLGYFERCLNIMNEIKISTVPSRTAYSKTIVCLFRSGHIEEGWSLMDEMLLNDRLPENEIYIAWLEYCSCTFATNKGKMEKWIERMLFYWKINELKIDQAMATVVEETYKNVLNWKIKPAYVNFRGVCSECCHVLKNDPLSLEEYDELKENFLNDVIICNNIFKNSSPKELELFKKHITKMPFYDMVLDGLNVVTGSLNLKDKRMTHMLDQLAKEGRKVLILGRKHLRRFSEFKEWEEKAAAIYLLNDETQDDPFMLYAAMVQGPNTDFMSNDLMKTHSYLLRNGNAQALFLRWQRQHQYRLLYVNANRMVLRRPIQYSPFPQKHTKVCWHIPYDTESVEHQNVQLDMEGAKQWLCMKAPMRSVRL